MLHIIQMIDEAVGAEKITVMRAHPGIKKILQYAYDPFKRYYMTAPDLEGVIGGYSLCGTSFSILDDISERSSTGNNALERVCDHMAVLKPSSAEVFRRIINKDLRCGVSIKTVNAAFPGLIPLVWDGSQKPPVMLLKNLDMKKVKFPCLAAIKKDGVRGLCNDQMISRSGHRIIGHDHIEEALGYMPGMDGEICIPGLIFDEASGLIRDKSPTPNSEYWIFDAPDITGTKLERYKWLQRNLINHPQIHLLTHYWIKDQDKLYALYKWALRQGEEGIVVYDPDSGYEDKRSHDWMRLVPIPSADCRVTGFEEGKGKFQWSLGKLIVDYHGHSVKVGTGFKEKLWSQLTDAQRRKWNGTPEDWDNMVRQHIWDNQWKFIDKVAKINYKEKTKAGSMRQPRFDSWRFDK